MTKTQKWMKQLASFESESMRPNHSSWPTRWHELTSFITSGLIQGAWLFLVMYASFRSAFWLLLKAAWSHEQQGWEKLVANTLGCGWMLWLGQSTSWEPLINILSAANLEQKSNNRAFVWWFPLPSCSQGEALFYSVWCQSSILCFQIGCDKEIQFYRIICQ